MKMSIARAALAAGLLGSATGITLGMAFAEPDDAAVKIDNFTFGPNIITVKVGTAVTWTNHDYVPHTVISTMQQFRSPVFFTDDKFTFTFSTPGTYQYFCTLHPKMTGTVVVEAAAGTTP
jgi:plastocyanin